ncbi:hypothetical protein K3F44_12395 [Pseudomonas sp. S07E 245]|uniref:hypothetical protein n=1 Tax=Pseudomonas sp. S07E 245 TaxID=2866278 RepID=UPI001C73B19C|nr:hypothetical protein [Pseudomonas sp. S07E 245]QYX55022.1 hypothetical protein K3F44_12395 [Pseudomonas sp. S07E 245]
MESDEHATLAAQHPSGVDAADAAFEPRALRQGRTRKAPSEAIHCKRFIRRLQTDNVLTALMAFSDRDLQADLRTWDLACEVYTTEQLAQIFDELVQSGDYSFGRLTEELMSSFDRLRDPDPEMHYPSVAAACTAVKREAKARLAKGDHQWARLDPETGRSPHRHEGYGWDAMTVALFDRMISDKLPRALDMRFAGDLGL